MRQLVLQQFPHQLLLGGQEIGRVAALGQQPAAQLHHVQRHQADVARQQGAALAQGVAGAEGEVQRHHRLLVGMVRLLPDHEQQRRAQVAGDPLQGGADEQLRGVVMVPADHQQVRLAVDHLFENLLGRATLAQE
ncbi:hypothetical protein D3C72_2073990 [compost metagenome]